jgi:hypothetical protein
VCLCPNVLRRQQEQLCLKKKSKKIRQKGSNDSIAEYCIIAEVRKKFEKKFEIFFDKKFEKKFEKMFGKITNCWRRGEGEGGEGGELSFQCLRPSTLLMAAGKNLKLI